MKSKYSSPFHTEVKQRLLLRRSLLADVSLLFPLLLYVKRHTLPFPRAQNQRSRRRLHANLLQREPFYNFAVFEKLCISVTFLSLYSHTLKNPTLLFL